MIEEAIVPLDGSVTAEVALPYAEEFTGRTGTELILLFVKEPQDYRSENILKSYLENLSARVKEEARQYFKESGITELKVSTKILTGNPAEEILNFAESHKNSKIIMATHGHSGVGTRWSLGSVADKVAHATTVPMVLVRAGFNMPEVHPKGILKTILAPLDGSEGSETALPYIAEMAQRLKAEVVFIQVVDVSIVSLANPNNPYLEQQETEARQYLSKLVEDYKKKGISARYKILLSRGEVANEINGFTRQNYTDIVIMATHGHSGPRRWVMGSTTNRILREGNTPIMLVRTPVERKE